MLLRLVFAEWVNYLVLRLDKHKPKVGKSTEVSGSVERKRLANITNMQHQPNPSNLDEKSQFIPASTKEYINELKKVYILWVWYFLPSEFVLHMF